MHRPPIISYLKNYLSVTKKEWNGLVILLMLIMLVLATPYVYQRLYKDSIINSKAIDKAALILDHSVHKNRYNYSELKPGYSKKLNRSSFAKKAKLTIPVALNTADSAKLTTIYGIGPAFARRIIKYRERLGGFNSKRQLKEVYGLDEEKYAEISGQVTVDPGHLKKININTATFDDLKRMPYLTFKQMNAIIQYRVQHGNYTSAEGLKEIVILNDNTIDKLKPYIVF